MAANYLTFRLRNEPVRKSESRYQVLPHILPDRKQWPIVKLSESMPAFKQVWIEETVERLKAANGDDIDTVIAKTIHLERIRVKTEKWKVDDPEEGSLWRKMQQALARESLDRDSEEAEEASEDILTKIVTLYADEIAGNFQIPTYFFARKYLSLGFDRLLNAAGSRNLKRFYGRQLHMRDRVKAYGELDHIRELAKTGTIILLPTHFSNLDSILIGWAVDVLGLPAFSYGAGLNLFNSAILGHYMNRLGAYKVDRRKRNPIYLETLKSYSRLTVEDGVHSLFFPGGTRSRSGQIESKLKMGLLGTVIEAQRRMLQRGEDKKVYIVPLVLDYHIVLEAKSLIKQHLKQTGQESFIILDDEFGSNKTILSFLWKVFSGSSEIQLSFGKPLDVLGNFVDKEGNSIGVNGNTVDISDYFKTGDTIVAHQQREEQYTRRLADIVVERFHAENIILSSHVVAYTMFQLLNAFFNDLDLYGVLRLPDDETYLPYPVVRSAIAKVQQELFELERNGKCKLSSKIKLDLDELIADGLKQIGIYHAMSVLHRTDKNDLKTDDILLLYYYHNKLHGYGITEVIDWRACVENVNQAAR